MPALGLVRFLPRSVTLRAFVFAISAKDVYFLRNRGDLTCSNVSSLVWKFQV